MEFIQFQHEFGRETSHQGVESNCQDVPRIPEAGYQGDRGHGPVIAQGGGKNQELEVEDGKVEECQQPRQDTITMRSWIICLGE